ncbi:hypothetical protein ADL21_02830 [Streptomyces albus subsp. albus]|nr:hypothetical protein ADL21_02830 [Streptomyces albus subsp. albus]
MVGLVVLGIAAVAGLTWLMGSVVLRTTGWLLLFLGLVSLANVVASGWVGAFVFAPLSLVLGAVLWLAGHWLFAFKHHFFRSRIAARVFARLARGRLDPTRGWGVPVIGADRSR